MAAPDPPGPDRAEERARANRSAYYAVERVTLARHLASVLERLNAARVRESSGDLLSPRRPVRQKQ